MRMQRRSKFIVVLLILSFLHVYSKGTIDRLLQKGIDFQALNSILRHGVFSIGDASVTNARVAELELSAMRCQDMVVGDIKVNSRKLNPRQVEVNVSILELDMRCDVNYSYTTALLIRGNGNCIVDSIGNSVNTTTIVETTEGTLASAAADSVTIGRCDADFNVTDMRFPNGILLGLPPVEALIKLVVERRVQRLTCDFLTDAAYLQQWLELAKSSFDMYPPDEAVVALRAESEMLAELPANKALVDFQKESTLHLAVLDMIYDQVTTYLTTSIDGTWRANSLIHKYLLKGNSSYPVEVEDDLLLWESSDRLTESSVRVDKIELKGLDSLTKFQPLRNIGSHTLQNEISFAMLEFQVHCSVVVRPSRQPDSFISDTAGNTEVRESTIITVQLDAVDAIASFLVAVDQDKAQSLELGALMQSEQLIPCVLSTLFRFDLAELSVSVADMRPLRVTPFRSAGLQRVFESALDAFMNVYREIGLRSLPTYFQKNVATSLGSVLEEWLMSQSSTACLALPVPAAPVVDLRDLLLDPIAAAAAGGSGASPYGDSIYNVLGQLNTRFWETGQDGSPKVNADLIRPVTIDQSGTPGELKFDTSIDLFDLKSSEFTSLAKNGLLRASQPRFFDLDTVAAPVQVLQAKGATGLNNALRLGTTDNRTFSFSTDLLFQIDSGDSDSPLAAHNDFELTMTFQIESIANFLISFVNKELLKFTMDGLTDINCWLGTLRLPIVRDDGTLNRPGGIELSEFSVDLSHLDIDVMCSSCTSKGFDFIPEIVATMRNKGILNIVEDRVEALVGELVRDYWESLDLNRHVWNARLVCPHHERYDPEATQSLSWKSFPEFSRDSVETIMFFFALAAKFGMIVTAKSHLLLTNEMDPLSAQSDLTPQQATGLLDWKNLDNSLGSWAESSLQGARSYVSGPVMDDATGKSDIGANIVARRFLDDGHYKLELHGAKIDLGGTRGAISQVRFLGLDTMVEAKIADAIASQTLQNHFSFKSIELELDIVFDILPGEKMTMHLGLSDLEVNSTMLAALNWESLGSAWLGSMLRTGDIVQCVIGKLDAANITELSVVAGDIQPPLILGNLSANAMGSLQSLAVDFFDSFRGEVLESVEKIAGTTIRRTINHILAQYLGSDEHFCKYGSPMTPAGLVDFRDLLLTAGEAKALGGSGEEPYGDTARVLMELFQEKVASDEMKNKTIISQFSGLLFGQSAPSGGDFVLEHNISASGSSSPRFSDWVLNYSTEVTDVYVQNYDSVMLPLKILQPVDQEPYMLDHAITVGVGPSPLRLGATFSFSLNDSQGNSMKNKIKVQLELQSVTTMLTTLLTVDEEDLFSTSLEDIQDPNCVLAAISTFALENENQGNPFVRYSVSAERVALNVSCVACEGPRMAELLHQLYNPGETDEEVEDFIASTSSVLETFIGSGFLQDYFKHTIVEAKKLCPSSPSYDPDAEPMEFWRMPDASFGFAPFERDPRMQIFNIANLAFGAILAGVLFLAERQVRKRHQVWLAGLSHEHTAYLEEHNNDDLARRMYIEKHTTAMSSSDQIPLRLRLAVPFVLVLNICLYMAAHIALLSYMNIEADVAGQRITIDRFMVFSFFGAAMRTYWTGGNEMALMAIIFSGIWPYIKLFSALCLWFAPPSVLRVSHREKFFVWMEILTKLSIIDIAMMLLAIATLLVFVSGPGEEFYDSEDLYAVTIAVVPRGGFYCILIAQRLNRVSSRFFLDYHEKIVSSASAEFWRLKASGRTDFSRSTRQTEESSHASASVSDSISNGSHMVKVIPLSLTPEGDEDSINEGAFEIAHVDSEIRRRFFFVFDSSSNIIEKVRFNYLYLSTRYHVLGGTFGAVLACFGVLALVIVGFSFAPSISVDVKESLAIALESDRTFAGAVTDFNVFRILILALLKSRFVLDSTSDYVGLCFLISLVVIGGMLVPAIQGWQRLRTTITRVREMLREKEVTINVRDPFFHEVRLRHPFELWKNIEIYVFAFCIANWQLSAVVAFFIHNYCQNLERFYAALSYVGLVDSVSTNCFKAQASAPLTLIILFGSFFVLLVSFVCQMVVQYKRNIEQFKRVKV